MATKTVIINGVTYSTVPEVDIPIQGGDGALAKFFEISDATIASDGTDMLAGVIAYDSTGVKRTGTIPTGGSANITLSASGSIVTAAVPSKIYFNTATSSSLTIAGGTATTPATTISPTITASVRPQPAGALNITVSSSQSITPTVTPGYISQGTAGTVTVSNTETINLTTLDSALKSENIRAGVTIFNITGDSNVVNTSIPTASAAPSTAILSPYQAYVNGQLVTGSVESKSSADLTVAGPTVTAPAGYYATDASATVATGALTASGSSITIEPVASINNSTGVVTVATQTQNVTVNAHVTTAGYVTTAQDSSATVAVTLKDNTTLALTTKAAATYTPGTQAQSVPSYRWLTGAQTIAGDTDLVSANIKSGVNIFGVAGSSTVVDTNDATATSADLLSGKTAYVKGAKVTGNIATKSSADLTVSGKTVTAPAGYYASAASKSVADGSATTPTTTITATATPSLNTSTGVVSITVSGSSSVTPTVSAGYVTAGTAGTISVSGSSSLQLTTKAAQTYTPGTADITITAGQYLTGAQIIKGDQNLQSGYIVSGKSIFGVEGTLSLPTITQDVTTKVLTIS